MTKFDSVVAKMLKAFPRRRTRMRTRGMNIINLIQCQEIDNRNNIMHPYPKGEGLEGGRLGMRRNK
jgi:hypothetical protein